MLPRRATTLTLPRVPAYFHARPQPYLLSPPPLPVLPPKLPKRSVFRFAGARWRAAIQTQNLLHRQLYDAAFPTYFPRHSTSLVDLPFHVYCMCSTWNQRVPRQPALSTRLHGHWLTARNSKAVRPASRYRHACATWTHVLSSRDTCK